MVGGGIKRKSGPSSVGANKKRKQGPAAGKANPFEFRKSKEKSVVLGKSVPLSKQKPNGNARTHAFEMVFLKPNLHFFKKHYISFIPS